MTKNQVYNFLLNMVQCDDMLSRFQFQPDICLIVSKIFNLCGHDPPTSQTDRQTTCDSNTALCTVVHRAVKSQRWT